MVLGSPPELGYGPGLGIPPMMPYYPSMAPYLSYPGYPVTMASDQSIARAVVNSINTDPGVPSDSDITVDVLGGIVTLTGTVPTKFAKHRAGDDAWWLPDVQNQLEIEPRCERGRKQEREKPEPHWLKDRYGEIAVIGRTLTGLNLLHMQEVAAMTFGSFGYGMNPYGMPTLGGGGMAGGIPASTAGLPTYGAPPWMAPYFPSAPMFQPTVSPYMPMYGGLPSIAPWPYLYSAPFSWGFGGLGGLQPSGCSFSEQYLSSGLPSDTDIEEMIYDAIDVDPLIPADTQIDVTCEAGTCSLSGEVPDKVVKHAAGQDAWWTTGVIDVVNNLQVTGKGPARSEMKARVAQRQPREAAAQPSGQAAQMAQQRQR